MPGPLSAEDSRDDGSGTQAMTPAAADYDAISSWPRLAVGIFDAPFFFAGKLYYVLFPWSDLPTATVHHAPMEASGRIGKLASKLEITFTKKAHYGSAVVYNSKVYLFYTEDLGDRRFKIRYKTSSAPEISWSPAEDGHDVEAKGEWILWGADVGIKIKAVVFNNKIYLFYWRNAAIYFKAFDGSLWDSEQTVNHWSGSGKAIDYHPWFDAAVVTESLRSYIFLAAATKSDPDPKNPKLIGVRIDPGHAIHESARIYPDWVAWNNFIAFIPGSIRRGYQGNVLQVFGCGSGAASYDHRRLELDLETGSMHPWAHVAWTGDPASKPTGAVLAALPVGVDGSFRQVSVVHLNRWPVGGDPEIVFFVYLSDHFRVVRQSQPLNTGDTTNPEPAAWTLLGVVEGPPPFTFNGATPAAPTSTLTYGRSDSKQVSTLLQCGYSASVAGTLGPESLSVGGEVSAAAAKKDEVIRKFTAAFTLNLSNGGKNLDGAHGWLVLCKPTLKSRTFSRHPALYPDKAGSRELMQFIMVLVENVAVTFDAYELTRPPKGMLVRQPTSNIKEWTKNAFPAYDLIQVNRANVLTASVRGGSSTVSLKVEKSRITTEMLEVGVKIKTKIGQEKLFGVSSEVGVSVQQAMSEATTIEDQVAAELAELPLPPKPGGLYVKSLMVAPAWLVPEENATFKKLGTRPYWVPTAVVDAQIIPWCITWRVDGIETAVDPAIATGHG
jgi:hypothetical protein